MYKSHDITDVHLEITQRCQAACPMCDRNQEGGADNLSTVMGFGMTEEDGEYSDVLMEVQVGLITGEMCGEIYNMFDFQDDVMVCAMETGKDSCVGDSGGPLLYQGVQVGITSWVSSIGY